MGNGLDVTGAYKRKGIQMYKINGFHYFTEIDSFENGCVGGGSDSYFDYALNDETVEGLKAKIAGFVGCEVSDLDLDSCEEIGRIDACRTENVNGDIASPAELAEWKAGKLTLYYATYSCYVMECKPVSVA